MSALSVFVGGPNLADQGVLRPPLLLWSLASVSGFWAHKCHAGQSQIVGFSRDPG